MTVNNNATLIEDMEGAGPTFTSIGGGQGATLNTDIFIAGSQSGGRRISNTTAGFWSNPGVTSDLTTSGTHVKVYIWVTHYSVLTAAEIRIGDSTTTYETHTLTVGEYPSLGGWWPVWVQVDAGTDTGTPSFSAADEFAVSISLPSVGGNAQNLIVDQIHSSARPVMTHTSTGSFSDFASTDASNAIGCFLDANGIYFLYGNIQIGSSAAGSTFSDSGVVIVAPEFSHLPSSSTWTGIDIDLSNASTSISWTDSVFGAADPSGATRRPDLIITGSSGTVNLSRNRFDGLRQIDLTSGVTMNDAVVANSGQIAVGGADISGTSVSGYTGSTGTAAIVWNEATDPNGELDNMSFTRGSGTTHAIELGASSPTTVTLTGHSYSGYNASNGQNDSMIYVARTSGTVTINISNGQTPSYRTAGATVNVVNAVTVSTTVVDSSGAAIQGARVLMLAASGGPLPANESVSITRSGSIATVSHTSHGLATSDIVAIRSANEGEYNGLHQITVTGANEYTFTISGTPASPATGSVTSTAVILSGETDGSGIVQDAEFNFTSNQPVGGFVRRGTSGALYKTGPISGNITSSGLSTTVSLVGDS